MKDIECKFPSAIDERLFFNDISINQVSIMKNYYNFLNAKNYNMASKYLNNSEVFFYGAWCLNLLENRLYAIGNYIIQLEDMNLLVYNNLEPSTSELYDGMAWIS